jgi:pimeloyl-ACP methyl ester carboxylesterase
VVAALSRHYTVIAPDLLGRGLSDKPRANYSLGGYADGMRDLLTMLGTDTVTVVGHSFGGGVAMQFGYQFPERTERMVLIAPGGLGPEVSAVVRVVTLPGFQQAMGLLTLPGVRQLATTSLPSLASTGLSPLRELDEVAYMVGSLKEARARGAIRRVVSSVDDAVIPARHAEIATGLAPGVTVAVIPDAGHFPHKDHRSSS